MRLCLKIFLAVSLLSSEAAAADDMCKSAGEAAKAIMTARQGNTDMSTLMAIVDQQQDPAFKKVAREMVMAAYGRPAYQTAKMQEKAIAEFSNDIQLTCYKSTNK